MPRDLVDDGDAEIVVIRNDDLADVVRREGELGDVTASPFVLLLFAAWTKIHPEGRRITLY